MKESAEGVTKDWLDELAHELGGVRLWLSDITHIDEVVEEIADLLVEKHHDYGEDNLTTFGELGILVRAADKVARLKNLIEKPALLCDERREDTWRDLAGYAIQALILMNRQKPAQAVSYFETRKKRLNLGFCPDCGKGVLLRRQKWTDHAFVVYCSDACGFHAQVDGYEAENGLEDVITRIAGWDAVKEQK